MLTDPRSRLSTASAGFIAAHRAINEVMGGRAVLLRDGTRQVLVSPLDGGRFVSETVAISANRAAYLGLPAVPALMTAAERLPDLLMPLALAQAPDLARVRIAQGGTIAAAATELAKLAERLPAMTVAEPERAPAGTLAADCADILAFRTRLAATVEPVSRAPVPLASGDLATVTAFRDAVGGTVTALAVGDAADGALVRIHSSCITGDVFGSLKCDCGAQLRQSLERISGTGGVLVYTAQEGRGIGLAAKLRAYTLQEEGLDTVDANVALGYHDDERDYAAASVVLRHLGLRRVRLLTNNPNKASGLAVSGLTVSPEPLHTEVTAHNAGYLDTKRRRSGHTL
ncbi:MAG: GTP cyclohydrolase II [Acuticoccus sp.]